jgi:hypothetical protein
MTIRRIGLTWGEVADDPRNLLARRQCFVVVSFVDKPPLLLSVLGGHIEVIYEIEESLPCPIESGVEKGWYHLPIKEIWVAR